MVLHVKYPSMERQDLSQSQLGAFKFTPVDEVVRTSPQPYPHPLLLQQYSQSLQNGMHSHRFKPPDITSNTIFSNHQIRPSLGSSQNQFGPTTVRTAVESVSTSPHRTYIRRVQDSMRANAQTFHPQLIGSSENESLPSMYTSETNGIPLNENGVEPFHSSHNSLLKALEAEQEAHEVTKTRLEQETNARREAEAETQRLAEHNKGLINSIKLLQSTIKHMVQKESQQMSSTRGICKDFKAHHNEPDPSKVHDSILYDVVAKYKAPEWAEKDIQETKSAVKPGQPNTTNLNTFSGNAQTQQILQSQTESSSQVGLKEDLEIRCQHQNEASVESIGIPRNDKGKSVIQDSTKSLFHEANANSDAVQHTTQSNGHPNSVYSPMLELPASFLSKYGRKPIPDLKESSGQLSSLKIPRKANLTIASAVKPRECGNENKPPSGVVFMPDTFLIQWKIDGRHVEELRGTQAETKLENYFREHPIRYVPKLTDDNLYRTVMIDFIPFGTPYYDLLNHIRGGKLESVQMYGPIGDATDFVTARVVFTDETGATGLYQRGQEPGIKINGRPVRVWQVLEPTYPKNKELEEAIYIHGHTRILIVNAPIDDIDQVLKRKLRNQIEAGLVLDVGRSYDGVPIVEFTSIEEATKALNLFLNDREFGGSDFDFDDDYCSAEYS